MNSIIQTQETVVQQPTGPVSIRSLKQSGCETKNPLGAVRVRTTSSCVCGTLRRLSANPESDGRDLVCGCLAGFKRESSLGDFAPQLLTLIVSPAYMGMPWLPELRAGIERELGERGLEKLPIIVSGYRENVFGENVTLEGAILQCLQISMGRSSCSRADRKKAAALRVLGLPS